MGHTGVPLRPPLVPARRKIRRRKRLDVPGPIRREVIGFARTLRKNFAAYFVGSPASKYAVTNLLRSHLPPLPRRRGRPARPEVTQALKMLAHLRRTRPGEPAQALWPFVYSAIINGHGAMNPAEQRDAEQQLRERVRWRRRSRRRARRLRRTRKNPG
jgi:hypothetical protein